MDHYCYIALISAQKRHIIKGYVSEISLHRLTLSSNGLFVPDDLTRFSIPVTLSKLSRSGAGSIDIVELASTNGGKIAVRPDDKQKLVPLTAQYLAEMTPQALDDAPRQSIRGVVELTGSAESFLSRAWYQVSTVLIRESGF